MKSIGGYFGLESLKGENFHKDAIKLNTARNCFEYVLRAKAYTKVYIPYYTCHVMLEPIKKLNIDFEFYPIGFDLEPTYQVSLEEGAAFLYTNYFGIKQKCVQKLATQYGDRLIVDNAQAFYSKPLKGVDTFYSARKFFGVADGAYLYTDARIDDEFEQDQSFERMSHLLKRADIGAEFGYQDFQKNDGSLDNNPIRRMSNLTEQVLCSVDYNSCRQKRMDNFNYLHKCLKGSNKLHLDLSDEDVPMVYPYLFDDENLREKLINNRVFVAKYWPNVLSKLGFENEFELAEKLLPLPIDQRNEVQDIQRVIDLIRI